MARDGFDIGSFANDIASAAGEQWDRSVKELNEGLGADMDRAVSKMKDEGFLQGFAEVADVFSAGNLVAETADAFNVIPEDPGLKEMISAGVNVGAGYAAGALLGPVGGVVQLAATGLAIKDGFDAVAACTTPSPAAVAAMPQRPQTPTAPKDARRWATEATGRRDGYCGCGVESGARASFADLQKKLRELYGEDKTDQADQEIDRLLKNKSLCFEDLVFLLMRSVIKRGQGEVKALGKQLTDVGARNREDRQGMNDEINGLRRAMSSEKNPARNSELGVKLKALEDKRDLSVEERMESRADLAEQLKNAVQKLSEMQQALSNVLNTQHETAMGAIRNIR